MGAFGSMFRDLYRSPKLKQRIEQRLSAIEGIHSVEANILTGRVLLKHAPDKALGDIIQPRRGGTWSEEEKKDQEVLSGNPLLSP